MSNEKLLEACKAAEEAMCAATFVKGVQKSDLNHAIDLCRAAIKEAEEAQTPPTFGEALSDLAFKSR